MTLPVLLLAADILFCWYCAWTNRLLVAAYMILPVLYLGSMLNHVPFPQGTGQLLIVAVGHVVVALHICYKALPAGKERGWLMLLASLVAVPFMWIVVDAGFRPTIMQDAYYMLTGSTMAASAIAGCTVAYIACFKEWGRIWGPLLVGVYFGVDVLVNAIWRHGVFNMAMRARLGDLDHVVHLVTVLCALWILRAERHQRNSADSSDAPEPHL